MFSSWSAPKQADAPPPEFPSSFDPLKGLKGAAGFYDIFNWPTLPKVPVKSGSSATFYSPPKETFKKGDDISIDEVGGTTSCQGVDQVNMILRRGKEQLADPNSKCKFRVIMGSEVADLDATVCSLVYAAVAYQSGTGGNPAATPVVPLPLLLTSRPDFPLRSETHWLLQSMGVDLSLLTFRDEVDIRKLNSEGRLQVVLVGIKNMPEGYQGMESAVLEILPKPSMTPANGASTEDGYSGAVMLAKKLSEELPEIFLNPALCRLLLASILLSTNCLDSAQSVEVDSSMAAFLVIGAGSAGYVSFYEQLRTRKYNQTFLSTEELLRSDFALYDMGPGSRGKKGGEVLKVGICNVAISLAEMVAKDTQFAEKLKAFTVAHKVHALILLGTYYSTSNKRFKKEIAVISDIQGLLSGACFFLQQEKHELKLRPITIRGLPSNTRAFAIGNIIITRPDIEKKMVEFFDDGR